MIIVGSNNDDKGTQLENLTRALLEDMHFTNITRNYIAAGGLEIDVRGLFPRPNVGETQYNILICECKATRSLVDTTQWLKFLGKVYEAEAAHGENVNGCFIALSGVNGNVAGSYDSLRTHRRNVKLVRGEELTQLAAHHYGLCDIAAVNGTLGRFTARLLRDTDVLYYDNHLYWIVYFEGDYFTVLAADGGLASETATQVLLPMFQGEIAAGRYLNLMQEHEAQLHQAKQRNEILTRIFIADGGPTDVTLAWANQAEETEYRTVIEALVGQGLLVRGVNNETFSFPAENNDFPAIIATIFRLLLTAAVVIEAIGCQYYDAMIERYLIDEVLHIQGDLPLDAEDREKAVQLLQTSPLALAQLLQPDPMLSGHREHRDNLQIAAAEERRRYADIINSHDVNYFFRVLTNCLMNDFMNPILGDYFFRVRHIREIEMTQTAKIKTRAAVIYDHTTLNRQGIGEAAPELGESIIRMSMLADVPQPWEEGGIGNNNTATLGNAP